MWVYPSDEVRISPETTALLPQLPAESGTPKQPVPEPLNAGEAMPDGVAQQPERLHRRMRRCSRSGCCATPSGIASPAFRGSGTGCFGVPDSAGSCGKSAVVSGDIRTSSDG